MSTVCIVFICVSEVNATMSKRMKQCRGDLNLLGGCSSKTRKVVLKNADNQLINAIAEAAWSVLDNQVPLTPAQRARFRKDESILRQLATKQRTPAQKRKVLTTQRGGNIIGFLFNALKSLF